MKKNIKGLDHYFEAARTQSPVFSLDEARALIRQPAGALSHPGENPIAKVAGLQKMVLASHVLTVVATVLACWHGMVSGSPAAQQKISSQQVARPSGPQAQVMSGAGRQMPPALAEAAPGKGAADPLPAAKDISMAASPDPGQVKAPNRMPEINLSPVADELKHVAEPVGVASLLPLKRDAVKTPEKTAPADQKPGGLEQVHVPVAFVEIAPETARKLGFTLDEKGIRFEMDAPLGIEHITKRPPSRITIEVSNHTHVMRVTNPPGAKTNEGKLITEYVTRQATSFAVHPGGNRKTKSPVQPYPLFITDTAGKQRVKYKLGHEDQQKMKPAYFNEIINSLVPVLVKANNAAKDQALFWFERSDALLAALPAGQREALWPASGKTKARRNKNARDYKSKETGKAQPFAGKETAVPAGTETPPAQPGDLIRTDLQEAPHLTVFPNPSAGRVHLDVSFRQPQAVTIYLADIAGRLIKVLSPMQLDAASFARYHFDLSATEPGVYVVVVVTKAGHKSTQRLIIQ